MSYRLHQPTFHTKPPFPFLFEDIYSDLSPIPSPPLFQNVQYHYYPSPSTFSLVMDEGIARRAEGAVVDALLVRMGDLVTAVWDFSLGLVVNPLLLPRNAPRLDEEMARLQELRDDLSNRAEQEAWTTQNEVTQQLSGWINRVDTLHSEAVRFQDSLERQSICITGICLGYDAAQLLRRVNTLIEQRNALTQLVVPRRPGAVEEVPLETSGSCLVGAEETLRQIQGHILDTRVGIIGIYGMGGIGKTTLLQIINNELLQGEEARGLFDMAIWVTVPRDVDILGIQKAIGDRVGLSLSDDDSGGNPSRLLERQAKVLFNRLSQMPFILLLDDVWQKLDLMKIGIPPMKIGIPPSKNVKMMNRKVLFTTRSEQVCNEMDADQRVKVYLLDGGSSMTLFKSKLSTEAVLDDDDIRPLAEQVVAKCGGLPISLITVGRAMANASTPNEWCNAINALDHCARELSGMETVLASLKFSYDMLKDGKLQSCLLYCALFWEDYNIPKRWIIDYWVCEGLLDPENSQDIHIDDTRNRGHARIRDLQNACLLEEGHEEVEETVRLHDAVRDMALWITEREFVVLLDRTSSARVPLRERWENATRISAGSRMIPSGTLKCPNQLTTLLLCYGAVGPVPVGLFTDLDRPALRVLDLNGSRVEKFPIEITSLIQLQYLSLENTGITDVPKELGKLVNLRHLNLSLTRGLWSIRQEAISGLTNLQVLNMWRSGYVFDPKPGRPQQLILSDLENLARLARLCEFSLDARSWPSLKKIVVSNLLRDRARHLTRYSDGGCPSGTILSDRIGRLSRLTSLKLHGDPQNPMGGALGFRPGQLPNLESLELFDFTNSELAFGQPATRRIDGPLFRRLRYLTIMTCHGFVELTWLGQLPRLERIFVAGCNGVTELLLPDGDGLSHDGPSYFPELTNMALMNLPALRLISTRPLLFPSLESLFVLHCPCLKQLPFGPESARKIKVIAGQQDWWDGLQWDNYPDGRSKFLAYFKAYHRSST